MKKTFIGEGEKKPPNQVAGEILSFFTRNNFQVTDRGETVTYVTFTSPSVSISSFVICMNKFGIHFKNKTQVLEV